MDRARVSLLKAAPELYKAISGCERLVNERIAAAGIDDGFAHLLRLRASQMNGCAYCVRLHTRDALASGESADRVSLLPAWRESDYFSARERAALALIEAITLVADGQVPDAVYAEAERALSPDELTAVEWLGIIINAWNRIAISSRTPVRP